MPPGAVKGVSDPVNGSNNRRLGRIVLQLEAETADVHVDSAGISQVLVTPHLLQQLVPGQDNAAILHQDIQEIELAGQEVERPTRSLDGACPGEKLDVPGKKSRGWRCRRAVELDAAEKGTDTSQ